MTKTYLLLHLNCFLAPEAMLVHLAVVCVLLLGARAASFQHPGVFINQQQLNYVKAQVAAKTEPFYTAYQKALENSICSLSYKPKGPPSDGVIDCGSYSNPDYGCSDDDSDGSAAYMQALLWFITGTKQYATNSITLLNKYGSSLKQFNNSNAPLQAAWSALKWTRAAELIRYTNAGWASSDITAYENLLTKVYLPLMIDGSSSNGNWELSMIEAMLGIAVFNENLDLFNRAVGFWKQRVPAYYYYEPLDGSKPQPAPRGTADWYGQQVFNSSVNGICQETCRDLGHTQYGTSSALNAAETARIQGVDLYGSESARLTAALEFNTNLLIGAKVPSYVCGGKVDISYDPTFEVGYNQYHNRSGSALPHTWQDIITHVRTMSDLGNLHMSIWETLTHGGSPAS
jgi:hypothetical protein